MNTDIKQQAHKEFDEKYLESVLKAYSEYTESHKILLNDIKSFLDSIIDRTVQICEENHRQNS